MTTPSTLIFVDFPSPDPDATAAFYRDVFGWEVEGRPAGVFQRIVPGGEFPLEDGTNSGVGNLHLGVYNVAKAIPDPNSQPAGGTGRPTGPLPRVYVLVSPDDSQSRILAKAEELGAEILWRDYYWAEFNGFHASFRDPWGSQIVLWTTGGEDPKVEEGRRVDDMFTSDDGAA